MKSAMSYLTRIPQYTRNLRHLKSVLWHATPTKISNLIRVEIERRLRRISLNGFPYLLIVDPCNVCNLSCPLCPTGSNKLNRNQCLLSLDEFKSIFDKFKKYLFEVSLHNWGESLLNKDIYGMIKYVQSNNVGTNLSSNIVTLKPDDIENIIESGLEYFIVSLDATSPDIYDKYRIGGDFNRVIENLNLLLKRRREEKSKTPVVEWQFIVMSINQHQINEAKEMSKKIGVNVMRFIPVGLPFDADRKKELADEWFPANIESRNSSESYEEFQYGQSGRPGPCYYLYRSVVINTDGGLSPCCAVYNEKDDFGTIWNKDFRSTWNNEFYMSARSLFSTNDFLNPKPVVCERCTYFKKYPSKCKQSSRG